MRPSALGFVGLLVAATAGADTSPPVVAHSASGCARLPFDPKELLQAVPLPRRRKEAATVRVLTWKSEVDDRLLYVDSAIVWIALEPKQWMLAQVYRHPQHGDGWQLSRVYDLPQVPQRSYSIQPTRKDLDQFLAATWWHFDAMDGFKILASEICADAYRASFGAAPWHTQKNDGSR